MEMKMKTQGIGQAIARESQSMGGGAPCEAAWKDDRAHVETATPTTVVDTLTLQIAWASGALLSSGGSWRIMAGSD